VEIIVTYIGGRMSLWNLLIMLSFCRVVICVISIIVMLNLFLVCSIYFVVQAEAGIRYRDVTGVQTCALPIYGHHAGHLGIFSLGQRLSHSKDIP